jgi:CRISPR-associated RAMP protein (TIGR02581 family)
LRSHLESLLRGLDRANLRSCDPLADPCISKDDLKNLQARAEKEAEKAGSKGSPLYQAMYDESLTQEILKASCNVCKVFGSPWLAARVMIKDLFVDSGWWAGRFDLRDGVGIDRDTETARQGIKYDFEVVPASTRFRLEMVVENGDEQSIGLLIIGLRELEQGRVSLGGKTTRGLGHISLEIEDVEVIGDNAAAAIEGEGSTDLLDYLISGSGRKLKGAAMRDYFKNKVEAFAASALKDKE